MGWDFLLLKWAFHLIDIFFEMVEYILELNVAQLQHDLFNQVRHDPTTVRLYKEGLEVTFIRLLG
jgi:hypothetical protein